MRAEVSQAVGTGEVVRRLRDDHLPAVTGGGDPCRAMDVDAHVALVGQQRLARVEAHADADRACGERRLTLARGRERIGRPGESDEEGVALSVDLDAAVASEGVAKHAPVLGQCVGVGVAELVQQLRRALDVGEEKRDGAARKVAHPVKDRAAERLCQGSRRVWRNTARRRGALLVPRQGRRERGYPYVRARPRTQLWGRAVRPGGTDCISPNPPNACGGGAAGARSRRGR